MLITQQEQQEKLLARHGWVLVCLSPFEIQHTETGSFATGCAAEIILESFPPLERPLQLYRDAATPAPPCAAWPLDKELYQAFIGGSVVATFTALIPLEKLVLNGTVDALNDYCQQAFGDQVEIANTEYRVIVQESNANDWNERFAGDVALQVSCTLHAVD
jgi:hypothetical protein